MNRGKALHGTVGPSFARGAHDHTVCLEEAVQRAEALCEQRGVRLTKQRRDVLEIVWSGHRPLGAYDILAVLVQEQGRKPQPPTVYRALEFLQDQGLVHRVESLNAFVGCPLPGERHSCQLLLCRACGDSAEMVDPEAVESLKRSAGTAGFEVEKVTVELKGLCPRCASDRAGAGA